ncbi:MAG: lysophospholipid acyltransferase family protein [Candidatus Palauibacterales bacterium]|nr:lysophospholipid acyltransferase family protein [Candidatus Palauibacterales bacterium]
MRRLASLIVSALVWTLWALLVVAWTPMVTVVWACTAPWDRRRLAAGRLFRLCARAAIRVNPFWSVRFEGRLPRDRSVPYVVVCNHESMADVVLVGCLPWEMKWLSKRAILRTPFLGLMMRLVGDVAVRRRDAKSRKRAYERLREWLWRGVPVIIFPEGTRAPTPELLPFHEGAFRLALETGSPILPLALTGTRRALAKGSIVFGRARAVIRILEPVEADGDAGDPEDVARLTARVREAIDRARRRPVGDGAERP